MAVIKRFGVLKTASFTGLYLFFVGFIISLIMWLVSKMVSNLLSSLVSSLGGTVVSTNYFSIIWVFILPFFYGIIGFISGLIFIPIMNLVLKMTKGINFDLELAGHMY